jgi:hypothetical protein
LTGIRPELAFHHIRHAAMVFQIFGIVNHGCQPRLASSRRLAHNGDVAIAKWGCHECKSRFKTDGMKTNRIISLFVCALCLAGLVSCQKKEAAVDRNISKPVQPENERFKKTKILAEQGHAEAQCLLGVSYEHGDGVPQDFAEAVNWFRKAAAQGHAAAQCLLGESYYQGEGVPRDYAEAVKWFRRAADQGQAGAQYDLGLCYRDGEGVTKNYLEACKWALLANAQSQGRGKISSMNKDLVSSLESQLTQNQIAEAQRLAGEFKPQVVLPDSKSE